MKKVNDAVLTPLIETELRLTGQYGPFEIVTKPVTFEDKSKMSQRHIGEVQEGVLSPQSYFEDNHPERRWDDEKKRLEEDAEFTQSLADRYPAAVNSGGGFNPFSGEQGNPQPPAQQQQRNTPGSRGVEGEG